MTAFGVLFDFTGNPQNTTVQKVEDMVNEKWASPLWSSQLPILPGLTILF